MTSKNLDPTKCKAPIVKYFRFLNTIFGMNLVEYRSYGFASSRWSNKITEIKICYDYTDERPFSAYVYPSGGDAMFYEYKLVPPRMEGRGFDDYAQTGEWLLENIRPILLDNLGKRSLADLDHWKDARKIFYECYGNYSTIEKRFGNSYRQLNPPAVLERKWAYDIRTSYLLLAYKKVGFDRFSVLLNYSDVAEPKEVVEFCIRLLSAPNDDMTALLIYETLVRLIFQFAFCNEKIITIKKQLEMELTKQSFSVHPSYPTISPAEMKNRFRSLLMVLDQIRDKIH